MIRLPTTIEAALEHSTTHDVRAGGTDIQERRNHGRRRRPVLDLRDIPGLDKIERDGEGLKIGARVRLAELAEDPWVRERYPALAKGAASLGNPQIRAVATLGGNLLQAPRCAYYRDPEVQCLKSGGSECWARQGDHLWHVCFATRPCIAPHASTMGMVLAAYDATVSVAGGAARSVEELYDIGDTLRDHTLDEGVLLTHINLPRPWSAEQGAYMRATSRARAEWALVEVVVRLRLDRWESIVDARVAVGAVANTPLRLREVERLLVGNVVNEPLFVAAGEKATEGAEPLEDTAYKVELLRASVFDALNAAVVSPPSPLIDAPDEDGSEGESKGPSK